jgi:hypothetical protein
MTTLLKTVKKLKEKREKGPSTEPTNAPLKSKNSPQGGAKHTCLIYVYFMHAGSPSVRTCHTGILCQLLRMHNDFKRCFIV